MLNFFSPYFIESKKSAKSRLFRNRNILFAKTRMNRHPISSPLLSFTRSVQLRTTEILNSKEKKQKLNFTYVTYNLICINSADVSKVQQ